MACGCGNGGNKKKEELVEDFECRKGASLDECCVTGDASACDCTTDEQDSSCGCREE